MERETTFSHRKPSHNAEKLSFVERCRAKEMDHIAILEDIAANDPNTGFRLTAIRDLMDRGRGRP
jgi:hypothetical protein